ncbi:MAG: hypothetical protein KatS3mg052_0239 [Candidatus Roseilinea sp.]|nr:MAG: hypothetical protein KatS3mg052_0239 [Candidatus Roseilinea sp.]
MLERRNPLSKIVAVTPLMAIAALSGDVYLPLALTGLALFTLLVGGVAPKRILGALVPLVLVALGFLMLYPLIVRRELVMHTPAIARIGDVVIYAGALRLGLVAMARVLALVSLSLIFSLTTPVDDFVRALVQQARVPYRVGYAALAALRFAPLLRDELAQIRAAHRVRGLARSGVVGELAQARRALVPLLASAIRRAERAALAMDGRAFGAYPQRTYLRRVTLDGADVGLALLLWAVAAAIILAFWALGWLGPLSFVQRV